MFVVVIPGAGRALDAAGSRVVLAVGTSLTAIGLAIFAFGFGSTWVAIGAMVVAGTGFGALLGAPTRYIVTNRAGSKQRSAAVGLLSVCLILGQILGGSLAGGVVVRRPAQSTATILPISGSRASRSSRGSSLWDFTQRRANARRHARR